MGASPEEKQYFDAVVIGSGFGGTITALTLANYFESRKLGEKVCVLERGQWWISHELPFRSAAERSTDPVPAPNMREFLQDHDQPFDVWAHPDNVEGFVDLASKARLINKGGLYDYRPIADNVHVLAASGVGGGSLVYSNVTLEPPPSVYKDWPTEKTGQSLARYFEPARTFIGVNRITTIAGLGPKNSKLSKSRVFQEAAAKVASDGSITNLDPRDPDFGFAIPLSITDVPIAFNNLRVDPSSGGVMHVTQTPGGPAVLGPVTADEHEELLGQQNQQNVCQRQGRCNLGCLPGARHTLNKKFVTALGNFAKKNEDVLSVQALCEAELIEFVEPDLFRIHYRKYLRNKDTRTVNGEKTGVIETKMLVVAAGTMGTNELLLKSRAGGLKVSEMLGKRFSSNGDLFGFMKLNRGTDSQGNPLDITKGPINTNHALFKSAGKDFEFSIEDTTLSKMVAPLFATLFDLYVASKIEAKRKKKHSNFWSRLWQDFTLLWKYRLLAFPILLFGLDIPRFQRIMTKAMSMLINNAPGAKITPGPLMRALDSGLRTQMMEMIEVSTRDYDRPFASPEERLSNYFVFSCMGIDNADGRLDLSDSPTRPVSSPPIMVPENLVLKDMSGKGPWSIGGNRQVFEDIILGMEKLAEAIEPGNKNVFAPTWNKESPDKSSLVVLHPLGGCRMWDDADSGVVNSFGQVFRDDSVDRSKVYDNFYIIDGSIVPSALGINSSLTIAALAFRCAEHITGKPDFWPEFQLIQEIMKARNLAIP